MGEGGAVAELLRDRYELLEVLGQGGEGRVVKALDRRHNRFVALKIRSAASGHDREELLAEARILLALPAHPNLPLAREDFFDGDQYVIAMDWVDGTDLGRLLHARGSPGLAPSMVVQWLADAASGLTHLHTQDPPVIHGDIKPANLILDRGGRVTVVDFGLSSGPHASRRWGGTRGYVAPELAAGRAPGATWPPSARRPAPRPAAATSMHWRPPPSPSSPAPHPLVSVRC